MAESVYSQNIYDKFATDFGENWIDSMSWTDGDKRRSLVMGVTRIKSFIPYLFSNASRLVLSADYLINDVAKIDALELMVEKGLQDTIPDDKRLQTKLMISYSEMLYNLYEAIRLLKYHINLVRERFSVHNKKLEFTAILLDSSRPSRDEYIELFDQVCDICFLEYKFSYNEEYIQNLLFAKESLERKVKEKSGEISVILGACLTKVELLLSKLSVFSKRKQIIYNYDFKPKTIELSDSNKYPSDDFRNLYLKYLDPERLDYDQILAWQKDSHNKDVAMWQLAFLMRYYTKITKSQEQIESLIKIADKHYKEYVSGDDHNAVNDYAARSFRNYMYNSRFSFVLCHDKTLTLKQLQKEIARIESIQSETFIFNYHPYHKLVEYLCLKIDELLNNNTISSEVEIYNEMLQAGYKHLVENYDWCRRHQPYLMQLRYKFSTIEEQGKEIKVFYPSSFCRPLRFGLLKEKIEQLKIRVSMLDYQVRHVDEHRELIMAKSKIESMERKNMEHMGIFVTIMTFLVGLLSIFVGNSGGTLTDKMEYTIALGLILILFVCIGFFFVSDEFKKVKPWIFGVVGVIILTFIGVFVSGNIRTSDSEKAVVDSTVTKEIKAPKVPELKQQ